MYSELTHIFPLFSWILNPSSVLLDLHLPRNSSYSYCFSTFSPFLTRFRCTSPSFFAAFFDALSSFFLSLHLLPHRSTCSRGFSSTFLRRHSSSFPHCLLARPVFPSLLHSSSFSFLVSCKWIPFSLFLLVPFSL